MTNIASSSTSFNDCTPVSCWKYDVFLSFRGIDTRKTFVDHLYSALVQQLTCTYKDDETLQQGDTIGPSLLKAIEESQIAVIIFSKNYANSSWCLDELAYIMKCRDEKGQTVIPIFYDVEPSEVRKQKGEFGKAFAKVEQENTTKDKVESWRKALVDASNIAGWEPKLVANGHEAKCIKDIVATILDKLLSLNSVVDENLVGMGTRLHDIKSQLEIGSGGVRMVGIWGVGGGGKTTLASSIFTEISGKFDSYCFVDCVREESSKHNLKYLQEKILSQVLKTQVLVPSVGVGKNMIRDRLSHRNVLIVLDDVDDRKQLEALAGSHDWFGKGSRIIVTTRNEHLLRTHRVDVVSHVSLLSEDEAIRLFNKHAYDENNPIQDYMMLSERVVSYAGGLPLALKVLGSFLYDKDKSEWISALDRLKDNPNMEIMEILKISYDGLEPLDKELFLDVACFYRGHKTDSAMEKLDACGFHPRIGVKVLIQKALITISKDGEFDMHDLIEEMGHYIVRGKHPNNPERHSRLWRLEEIDDMCLMTENDKTEAIRYRGSSLHFPKVVSHMTKLRMLDVFSNTGVDFKDGPSFLSDELRYICWHSFPRSPFPESFHPSKLVVLTLYNSLQEELWEGKKYLPCLKELELIGMVHLVRTPDFGGLPSLQKLTLKECDNFIKIHPSLGNCTNLISLNLSQCKYLMRINFSLSQCTQLKLLNLSYCEHLVELPILPSSLSILEALCCYSLEVVEDCYRNCEWLCQVSLLMGPRVTSSYKVLETMLKGKAIESHRAMSLQLKDYNHEIAKRFRPRLRVGSTYRWEFPDKWYNNYSGFLICVVFTGEFDRLDITMTHVHGLRTQDRQHGLFVGQNKNDERHDDDSDEKTWVVYVPFNSLRRTTWWNEINNIIEFSIDPKFFNFPVWPPHVNGFGVTLIPKKNQIETSSTNSITNSFSEFSDDYKCDFRITIDTWSFLVCSFSG